MQLFGLPPLANERVVGVTRPSEENHSCSVKPRTRVVIHQVDANYIIGPRTQHTAAA